MAYRRQHVLPVRVEVLLQLELVSGHEVLHGALRPDHHGRRRPFVHPDPDRPLPVAVDLLQLRRLLPAPRVDPVETLRVLPGIVVDLQLVHALHLQIVRLLSNRKARHDLRLGLQVRFRQLETVIPESVLPGTDLLLLLPCPDPVLVPNPSLDLFVDELALPRQVRVVGGAVGNDHLVVAVGVLEEEVDSLLLHQPRSEVEVRLPVLYAVVSRLVFLVQPPVHREPGEDLLQDLRHRHPLEDPALRLAGQQPDLRHELCLVLGEELVLPTLGEPHAEPVQVRLAAVRQREIDRDLLAQDRVERHFSLVLREHLEPVAEERRDRLRPPEPGQEQFVRPERSVDAELSILVLVLAHRDSPFAGDPGTQPGQAVDSASI